MLKLHSIACSILIVLTLPSSVYATPPWKMPAVQRGKEVLPGVMVLVGQNLKSSAASSGPLLPELADPYATVMKDSVLVSGTAPYALRFLSLRDMARGKAPSIIW